MGTKDWIAIGIAAITLINGWLQFWVKERFFAKDTTATDPLRTLFKSQGGITFIAITGIISIVSLWLLVSEVMSSSPLTRIACFSISALTALSVLNMALVQSLFTLRRIAALKDKMDIVETLALLGL